MPDITMENTGFIPSSYSAQLPPGQGTTVTFQGAGEDPPPDVYTFLSDEVTPYSLFGGTGNSYAVPSDRDGPLHISKDTPAGTYVTSPTATVNKGTKGTINVTVGAVEQKAV